MRRATESYRAHICRPVRLLEKHCSTPGCRSGHAPERAFMASMARRWQVVVEELGPIDRDAVWVVGEDRGDLIVTGDSASVLRTSAPVPEARVYVQPHGFDRVSLRLAGIQLGDVAVADTIAGGGAEASPGAHALGVAEGQSPRVPADDDELQRMSWDAAVAYASRGSSGHWTASLRYLPLSFGGGVTEADAMAGLGRKHRESLLDDAYRAAARRVVLRCQGHDPVIPGGSSF